MNFRIELDKDEAVKVYGFLKVHATGAHTVSISSKAIRKARRRKR